MSKLPINALLNHLFAPDPIDELSLRFDRLIVDHDIEGKKAQIQTEGWEIISEVSHSRRDPKDRKKIHHYLVVMSKKAEVSE